MHLIKFKFSIPAQHVIHNLGILKLKQFKVGKAKSVFHLLDIKGIAILKLPIDGCTQLA